MKSPKINEEFQDDAAKFVANVIEMLCAHCKRQTV